MRDCARRCKRQNRIWEVIDSSNNYFSICDARRAAIFCATRGACRGVEKGDEGVSVFVHYIHQTPADSARSPREAMLQSRHSLFQNIARSLARHMLFLQNNLPLAAEFNP
jgi:hypothetical protein